MDRAFDYALPDDLEQQVRAGSLVRIPFGGRRVRGIVVGVGSPAPEGLEPVAGLVTPHPVAPPPLPELLAWVARRYCAPAGRTFARVVPPRVRVKVPAPSSPPEPAPPARLGAYIGGAALQSAIAGGSGAFLLRVPPGEDTGALVAELALTARGQVLVAVPEVAFGSRVIDALTARYPETLRIDSAAGDAVRAHNLQRMAAGHPVAAGGRAAVLAPAPGLRLLVVDDEEHISYKEDRSPRYDATMVALRRAAMQSAVCVLVSAAPSVEVSERARRGELQLVEPERAAERAARPVIEVLAPPEDRTLSRAVHGRIRDTLRAGEGVALLVPRTGYARVLWCVQCRHSVRCSRCESALAFHRAPRVLRCPRCSLEAPPPDVCPSCGASEFRYLGAGSDRLAEQVAAAFPDVAVTRMDARVQDPGPVTSSGPSIYVTTYFGTKPELRPPAKLVVVLDADALIRRPDFRAAERAYQTLVQMAGWAGPGSEGGRLVVQTTEPNHHALQAVARSDHWFFVERERAAREELRYPPFSELIRLESSGPSARAAIDAAARECRKAGASVLGPVPRPDGTLEAIVKAAAAEEVALRLRAILPEVPRGTRLRVDVDPR